MSGNQVSVGQDQILDVATSHVAEELTLRVSPPQNFRRDRHSGKQFDLSPSQHIDSVRCCWREEHALNAALFCFGDNFAQKLSAFLEARVHLILLATFLCAVVQRMSTFLFEQTTFDTFMLALVSVNYYFLASLTVLSFRFNVLRELFRHGCNSVRILLNFICVLGVQTCNIFESSEYPTQGFVFISIVCSSALIIFS